MSTTAAKVMHDAASRVFKTSSGALIEYVLEKGGKVVALTHTFTPEAARGQGLAAVVTSAAFDWAAAEGKQVRPVCTYVRGPFLERNPQYQGIVVSDDA